RDRQRRALALERALHVGPGAPDQRETARNAGTEAGRASRASAVNRRSSGAQARRGDARCGGTRSGEGLTREMRDPPSGGCGATPTVNSRAPRERREARVAWGPARGGPRLSSGWDSERRRSRVRWWTQVPRTAIDSAPAALTGTPAAPFARAPPSRWPSAGAEARWLERGTRDR